MTLEQESAANDVNNHSLILATAGSGKTKTLIEKVKNVLKKSYDRKVILVTFTNAAVNEMQERLEIALPQSSINRVSVTTFHRQFLNQTKKLMQGKLLIGATYFNFIDRLKNYIENEHLLPELKVTFNDITSILNDQPLDEKKGFDKDAVKLVKECYQELKIKNHLYDLDDATRRAVEGTLSGEIPLLNCTDLMIDEFQDTDLLQYEWIALQGRGGINLTPVGDDDQSIYSWRGARSYETMLKFKDEFKPNIHMLAKCFRCRPEIIDASKNLIEFNKDRIPKGMVSGKEIGGTVKTYIHKFKKSMLLTFLENYSKYDGEWAILSRTNVALDSIEEFLIEHEVAYSRNNQTSIFKTSAGDFVIKLCSYLLNKFAHYHLSEVLGYLKEDENLIPLISESIKSNSDIESYLNNYGQSINGTAFEMFYSNYYLFENTHDSKEINTRIDLLIDFIIERRSKGDKLNKCAVETLLLEGLKTKTGSWFERIKLYSDKIKEQNSKSEIDKSVVTLTTYHGSKGLEWTNVAIFDVIQETMPNMQSPIDEERRLLFVGMTRAEQRLFIHSYLNKADIDDLKDVGELALFKKDYEYSPPITSDINDVCFPSEFIEEIYYKSD